MNHAAAAPLDALLDAKPARHYAFGFFEAGGDMVNQSVDVFGFLNEKGVADNVGEYRGGHLRLGWQLTDRLWVELGGWARQVSYTSDQPRIDSYSFAAQYRIVDQPSSASITPDFAVRIGYWSDTAKLVQREGSLPITDPPFNLIDYIRLTDVKDRQIQLDLIASWAIRPNFSLSISTGIGRGQVRIGSIAGTALGFEARNLGECSSTFTGAGITYTPTELLVEKDLCYEHNYRQIGVNVHWLPVSSISLKTGYLFQSIDRGTLDQRFLASGGKPTTEGHTLIGEAAYRVARFGQIFVRGQLMSSPFLGEIPLLYNRITASRFDREYGLLTFGLILDF